MLRLQGEERWPGAVLLALVLAPLEEGLLPAPPPSLFLPSFPCPPSSPLLSPLTRRVTAFIIQVPTVGAGPYQGLTCIISSSWQLPAGWD